MFEAAAGDASPSPPWKDLTRFRRISFHFKTINIILIVYLLLYRKIVVRKLGINTKSHDTLNLY